MDLAIEIVRGIVAPAAIALGLGCLAMRLLRAESWQRYAAAVPFAAAYCAGYALCQPWAHLVPSRHWHWTFYLAVAAAAIGPISLADGIHWVERWLLCALAAVVFAWLLVPDWPSLQPPRSIWAPILAGYLFLLAVLLEPLARWISPAALLGLATLTAVCVAVLILARVSATYARPAGIAAAALAGCWLAAWFFPHVAMARGLALAFAAIVGGWAFIGCIQPKQPVIGLMLVPLAPLALWCCAAGPLMRLKGIPALGVQTALVLAALAVGVGLALARGGD